MKITVFIAAYNQADYIEESVRSALNQDYPKDHYEVLVIDDGSTDDTRARLKQFEGQIRVLQQSNIGLPKTCNRGIQEARGEFFIRLDSDDFFDSSILSRMTAVLESKKDFAAVYSDHTLIFKDRTEPVALANGDVYQMVACGVMMRTEQLRKLQGYRNVFWEEYDLFIRLRQLGAFHHIPISLYGYRRHDTNMTNRPEGRRDGWKQLLELHGKEAIVASGNWAQIAELGELL